jgi:hypothetical protein
VAVLTSIAYARTRVRRGRTGQRVRLAATITAQTGGVFNLGHGWSNYGRTSERLGGPYFAWGPYATPPLEHDSLIAGTHVCTEPRFAWDVHRLIRLVLNDSGVILERFSADDALSFSAPSTLFATGSHPDISLGADGTLLRSAYVAGAISIRRQASGDTAIGAAFAAEDDAGSPLASANSVFRIVGAPNGWWYLHYLPDGATDTAILQSYDDAESWADAGGGIEDGTHPGMAVFPDATLAAWARLADGTARIIVRHAGDTAWSDPVTLEDDGSTPLEFADQPFSIAAGWEGPARWILAAVLDGESLPSEHFSSDFGESWTRFTP